MLVTGFDIIFFWVARMMMMGLKFMGDVPFRDVYITGLIRDENGEKMSKSKGNVIDPLDIVDGIELEALVAKRTSGLMQPHLAPKIEKATRKQFPRRHRAARHRCAALHVRGARLARAATSASTSARVGGYRNFCNKLWNAARFVHDDRSRASRAGRVGAAELSASPTAGSARASGARSRRWKARCATIASTSRPRRCTNSPGTSSATGTSS